MKQFIPLQKLKKGDQVAVISPSAGLPGLFPWIQDFGLERIRSEFGLVPKEYPTTREMGSSLEDRARDLMAAFTDPNNKAVITTIGGHDQIKLIKHLDPEVFLKNPKPFFGYSDNTHVTNFLWNLGIPSYYGSAVLVQFAMNGQMHEFTKDYLTKALFESGEFELTASPEFNDIGINWEEKDRLSESRIMEHNEGFVWDGSRDAKGILWGGCVESMIVQMSTGAFLPSAEDLEGAVLYLETAEDIPEQWIIEYLLIGMGERGWLKNFRGILIGRPKVWEFNKQNSAQQKNAYKQEQRDVVLKTVREYNTDIPVIQNLDFGHTDPQVPLPSGKNCRIDSKNQKIYLEF
jgi:muramoyltetrapeptide carboxypeptidase LdcA involved in peptidoglycan recycling